MKAYFDHLIQECYSSKIEHAFPERLLLLEEFSERKIAYNSFLKDVTVLFIQHHLSPFIGRLNAMQGNGMTPENTWFVDIPYSTNQDVVDLIQRKYTSHDFPKAYSNPLDNYSDVQLERVMTTIREIIDHKPSKLLVVDDGAYFIRAVEKLYAKDPGIANVLYSKTYINEQTTRGHRYLTSKKYNKIIDILHAPVVSIARSKSKLGIESPFIGVAARKSIEDNQRIRNRIENAAKAGDLLHVGVIGFGAIGRAVFETVKHMLPPQTIIDVIEIDYDLYAEIRNLGGIPYSEFSENKYDLLFGCTGYQSFGWQDRKYVNKEGLLISVSSASVEFSRRDFIEFANLYDDDPIEINPDDPSKGIHADLLFESQDDRFYFVNSGFPVNFTGKRECLPLKFIQPTHALLYAACYQVLEQPIFGVQSLKDEYDSWIYYNAFSF